MKVGDVIVLLVNSIIIAYIGYKVIGDIIPTIIAASYTVSTIANWWWDKRQG
jgi:hypothetical protein